MRGLSVRWATLAALPGGGGGRCGSGVAQSTALSSVLRAAQAERPAFSAPGALRALHPLFGPVRAALPALERGEQRIQGRPLPDVPAVATRGSPAVAQP